MAGNNDYHRKCITEIAIIEIHDTRFNCVDFHVAHVSAFIFIAISHVSQCVSCTSSQNRILAHSLFFNTEGRITINLKCTTLVFHPNYFPIMLSVHTHTHTNTNI